MDPSIIPTPSTTPWRVHHPQMAWREHYLRCSAAQKFLLVSLTGEKKCEWWWADDISSSRPLGCPLATQTEKHLVATKWYCDEYINVSWGGWIKNACNYYSTLTMSPRWNNSSSPIDTRYFHSLITDYTARDDGSTLTIYYNSTNHLSHQR